MSKALEVHETKVVHRSPQQLLNRAPVAHQQQMLHAAAAAQTATLQNMNPSMY